MACIHYHLSLLYQQNFLLKIQQFLYYYLYKHNVMRFFHHYLLLQDSPHLLLIIRQYLQHYPDKHKTQTRYGWIERERLGRVSLERYPLAIYMKYILHKIKSELFIIVKIWNFFTYISNIYLYI